MAPRCSNAVFAAFNVVTLLLGAAVLSAGIYSGAAHHRTGGGGGGTADCERLLRTPALVLGAAVMAASLAGLAGACSRATPLLWIYLCLTGLLILAALCFAAFALAVTSAGAGQAVSGRGFREYRLGDYSTWLRRRVEDGGHWGKIRSCLVEGGVCRSLQSNRTLDEFVNANLSPVQSGCCKPPTACNFTYLNETYWIKPPGSRGNSSDPDCDSWSNDQSELCYGCRSCKAGVLGNLRSNWKKIAIINAAFVVLLVVVYAFGCCALRNNRHKYTLVGK